MKTIDETWELGGRLGQHDEGAQIIRHGKNLIAYFEPIDGNIEARARLAAQAPAMARALLFMRQTILDMARGDGLEEMETVLRDAGVL